jgi:hypothetical protein
MVRSTLMVKSNSRLKEFPSSTKAPIIMLNIEALGRQQR